MIRDLDLTVYEDYSSVIYEKQTFQQINYSLLFIGSNGIFAIIDDRNKVKESYDFLLTEFHLSDRQVMLFIDNEGLFNPDTEEIIRFDNIEEAFDNAFFNRLIPECDRINIPFESIEDYCDLIEFETKTDENIFIVPFVTDRQIEEMVAKIEKLKTEGIEKNGYVYFSNGDISVKRTLTKSFGVKGIELIKTYQAVGETTFSCMEEDAWKFFLTTLFGGWFGLHKFKTKNYLSGILYLLTFGMCGTFYIGDLILILTGGYNYSAIEDDEDGTLIKQRYFVRPMDLKNKVVGILMTIVATVLIFLAVKFVYIPTAMPLLDKISVVLGTPVFNIINNKGGM